MTRLAAELAAVDATAQAELVRRGELTPAELVEAGIERVESLNPALNAVVTPMFERAATHAAVVFGPRSRSSLPSQPSISSGASHRS